MHIIVVEDDIPLGTAIQAALERLTYTVSWLRNGTEALIALRDQTADLILLDLGLPGKDGLDVLVEARRARVGTPVIVMTARDSVESRIQGLDAGADDYLVKPFHLDELAARIRSLTRRAQGLADNLVEAGALSMNLATSDVTWHGNRVELTRREFSLVQMLLERAGRLVRRDALENSIYGLDNAMSANALEVLVHGVRRKLSATAIQTVRGFGYMIPRDPR
ncbi:two-component system response regulator QseB [Luteibacter sp. Sphag1AF]|uniref:response regulator n=1 Tax=Luteibacter sp. Sphag1AF TaxID=2587031 RepID=UPI001609A730|nr:two-component system response regulator QseB [Luteibacter sp. Sphag1AF]